MRELARAPGDQALSETELQAKYGRSPIHTQILDDHFDQGVSEEILSAKYGRSKQQLGRLIKAAELAGRVRTKKAPDRRSVLHCPQALTRVHKRIGMKFTRWRTIENKFTVPEAAARVGVSMNRYHSIEGGIHNWTLLELVFICEKMEWNLVDLIRGADLRDYMSVA